MSTWKEYFDDFAQDILLYREKLVITEPQYMRWVAHCLRTTQRKVEVSTSTKVIAPVNGQYPLGDDVLTILVVQDADGFELFSTGIAQDKRLKEEVPIGFNEAPMRFSLRRDVPRIGDYGRENRWYTRHNNALTAYPEYTGNLTVLYTVDYHDFSSSSTQWAAWYPLDTAFGAQFDTAVPDVQQLKFSDCWRAYVTMKYFMINNNQNWLAYKTMLDDATRTLLLLKQQHYKEMTTPYNAAPFD